jgi:hypothetical protein
VKLNRRLALQAASAAAGAAAFGPFASSALAARDLKPTDPLYHWDEYERIANRPATIRALFEWPNINNPIFWGNLQNLLNGFQFSYDVPAEQIQVIIQAYATSNVTLYDDYIWDKYRWGEFLNVKDPLTGQLATRNTFYSSKNPAPASPPVERDNPYYSDTSIEGLQHRGVLFNI